MSEENFEKQLERNLQGIDLEKKGAVDQAVDLYELNVLEGFVGNHPYDRLAVIYRKRKQHGEEQRVLERAIEVFSHLARTSPRQDVEPKLERFRASLAKNLKRQARDA